MIDIKSFRCGELVKNVVKRMYWFENEKLWEEDCAYQENGNVQVGNQLYLNRILTAKDIPKSKLNNYASSSSVLELDIPSCKLLSWSAGSKPKHPVWN